MRSFQCVVVTVLFSLTLRTIDAATNGEAKGDGNELKTASLSVLFKKQMGIKQANLFGNRKLHGLFLRIFRQNLVMCDCDSESEFPSSAPSSGTVDSLAPSVVKSSAPSVVLSFAPSKSPSPSQKPSSGPSLAPSQNPSSKPSLKPSSKPSLSPSQNPSSKPSLKPSSKPSLAPSQKPSVKPSLAPSQNPSSKPSLKPSSKPSLAPSQKPSSKPSLKPSDKPSKGPLTSFTKQKFAGPMCDCLKANDDNSVQTQTCNSNNDDEMLWSWDISDQHLKVYQGDKAGWCLVDNGSGKPFIKNQCNDDAKIEFEEDGDDYLLKLSVSGLYFSFDSGIVSWDFLASSEDKELPFELGCGCAQCI